MKWGKKKPSSSSASSRPFLISHVLPTSWLTKFKQTSISFRQKHAKVKQKEKWNSVYTDSSACANSGGKIYGGDGDAVWRLSFGEDSLEGMNNINVSQSVQYTSDDDLEFLASSHHSCKSKASRVKGSGQTQKFSNTVSPVRKMKELLEEEEILPERTSTREKEAEIRTPRLKVRRDEKLRKGKQRGKQLELDGIPHEAERIPRNAAMKNVFETEPQRTGGMVEREDYKLAAFDSRKDCYFCSMNSRDSHGRKIEEGCVFPAEKEHDGFSTEKFSFEWQRLKEKKIEELKSRSEEQRKSLYISRELQRKRPKQNSKLKVYSPRTASKVETCKIKALEDMKKAKLKMKKKAKDKEMEEFKDLESFAMVKCSYDPQKDFRDSMTEMIKEQRISQPEELEELLACYLTLNSDEFHGLIIRAFQQVPPEEEGIVIKARSQLMAAFLPTDVTRSLTRELNKLLSEPIVMGDQREELQSMLQESQALNEAIFAQIEAQFLNLSKQLQEFLAVSNRSRGKELVTSSSSQPTSVNIPNGEGFAGTRAGVISKYTKLDFPQYDESDDLLIWLHRCNQFFQNQNTPEAWF